MMWIAFGYVPKYVVALVITIHAVEVNQLSRSTSRWSCVACCMSFDIFKFSSKATNAWKPQFYVIYATINFYWWSFFFAGEQTNKLRVHTLYTHARLVFRPPVKHRLHNVVEKTAREINNLNHCQKNGYWLWCIAQYFFFVVYWLLKLQCESHWQWVVGREKQNKTYRENFPLLEVSSLESVKFH